MQPVTLRRLLVFGVCLVAVSCLYLVPSLAGSSGRTGTAAGPNDARTTPPDPPASGSGNTAPGGYASPGTSNPTPAASDSALPNKAAAALGPANPDDSDHSAGADDPEDPADRATGPVTTATQRTTTTQAATAGRTAATAADSRTDRTPPTEVSRLWTTGTDPEQLSIAWSAATDEQGSVWYEVWVNGFNVTSTQHTEATVSWFNDSSTHVVRVRAVDLAGNRGPWSPTLMVTRPNPSPTPDQANKALTNASTTPVATPAPGDGPKEDNS